MTRAVAEPLIQASLIGEALDRGPVAVVVADEDKRYVAVNDYACRLLGYTREEFLSLGIEDVARSPDWEERFADLGTAGKLSGIAIAAAKDGTELTFHYRAEQATVAGMSVYVGVGWIA